jgi:hypothetical protein
MPDQIIDAVMACGLQPDARRTRPMVGWVVTQDASDYRGKVMAPGDRCTHPLRAGSRHAG